MCINKIKAQRQTERENRKRERQGGREGEQPLSLQLNELLTRFTDGGKSSIRRIVPLFFSSPLSANGPIVTRSSADTTHPLFHHPICATITWTDSPTHYFLTKWTVTFQETFPKNSITPECILCQTHPPPFFEVLYSLFFLHIMSFADKWIIEQRASFCGKSELGWNLESGMLPDTLWTWAIWVGRVTNNIICHPQFVCKWFCK